MNLPDTTYLNTKQEASKELRELSGKQIVLTAESFDELGNYQPRPQDPTSEELIAGADASVHILGGLGVVQFEHGLEVNGFGSIYSGEGTGLDVMGDIRCRRLSVCEMVLEGEQRTAHGIRVSGNVHTRGSCLIGGDALVSGMVRCDNRLVIGGSLFCAEFTARRTISIGTGAVICEGAPAFGHHTI